MIDEARKKIEIDFSVQDVLLRVIGEQEALIGEKVKQISLDALREEIKRRVVDIIAKEYHERIVSLVRAAMTEETIKVIVQQMIDRLKEDY